MTFREADKLAREHNAAVHPGVQPAQPVPQPVLGVEETLAVLRGSCEPLLMSTALAARDRAMEGKEK